MQRVRIDLSYDGTDFSGWQRQDNAPSVQGEIETHLSRLCQAPIEVVGCGRTDAGVHAQRYCAHADLPDKTPTDLAYRLNKLLPLSIAIQQWEPCAADFHARFSCLERGYTYRMHQQKDPFLARNSWYFPYELNVRSMNEACTHLIGKQSFASFCKGEIPKGNPYCEVREAQWIQTPQGLEFRMRADRFLRNMVRATVGTLLE
ncbi:MAG: tRNA pseudouridine(38-40) synthase TruA, partial [Bacteroidia bacterium]